MVIEELFFRDRSKRIAKIAASAAPHLEQGEEVRELFQVQSGQSADRNRMAVQDAYQHGDLDRRTLGVKSFAVLATDANAYVVALKGWRLLDVAGVIHKAPLADAQIEVHDRYVTLNGEVLHVLDHWGPQVEAFRDLLAEAKGA